MDSLDNSLDLGILDQLKELKLNEDPESISTRVVLFKHDGGEEVLLIDSLDVLLGHGHDAVHDLSACVLQTVELLDNVT